MFLNTKVLHVKIPFHVNFEEMNLRFYVKRSGDGVWKHGVVFIKEVVSKPAITFAANTLFGENYETCPTKHSWKAGPDEWRIEYAWKKLSHWNGISVRTAKQSAPIVPDSEEGFIVDHHWGYAKAGENTTNEYLVKHPWWDAYKVLEYNINVDFTAVYGEKFGFLGRQSPSSVMLAEGSELTLTGKKRIVKR